MEVKLVKEMGYERIDCACGMAVIPRDPTPEITRLVKKIAIEEGVKFSVIDASLNPEVMKKYKISKLPAVIIGKNVYSVDENILRKALKEAVTQQKERAQPLR